MGIAVGDKILTREERFWRRVEKSDGCWRWAGGRGGKASIYGIFTYAGVHTSAHRVAYELLIRPIPTGLVLDHLCGDTLCVNPEHVEPVTAAENRRRQAARVTHCRRAGHPLSGENLYIDGKGQRGCRACRDSYYWRTKAAR